MKWIKTNLDLYYLYLTKEDKGYKKELKKNETNIYAVISPEVRWHRYSDMKIKRLKRPVYKLEIADLDGRLGFKKLKNAKEFAEKTFEWMTVLEKIKI